MLVLAGDRDASIARGINLRGIVASNGNYLHGDAHRRISLRFRSPAAVNTRNETRRNAERDYPADTCLLVWVFVGARNSNVGCKPRAAGRGREVDGATRLSETERARR